MQKGVQCRVFGYGVSAFGSSSVKHYFTEKEATSLGLSLQAFYSFSLPYSHSIILSINLDVNSFFNKWDPCASICVGLAHGSLTEKELQDNASEQISRQRYSLALPRNLLKILPQFLRRRHPETLPMRLSLSLRMIRGLIL